MNKTRRLRCLWAGLAAVSLSALPALGQVRVEQGGANDANPRVGSGGRNFVGTGTGSTVTSNDIVYRNVTGGKGFRGPLLERDPGAFAGPVPGRATDRFIAGSSGVPEPYQPPVGLDTPQPFYGQYRAVAPPVGSVREGFTGEYLGTSVSSPLLMSPAAQYSAALDVYAQPLGEAIVLGTHSLLFGSEPGEVTLQGPLEAQNRRTLFSGSPLYGVRELQPGGRPTDNGTVEADRPGLFPNGPDQFGMPNADVRRMRQELENLSLPQSGQSNRNQQQQPGVQQGGQDQQTSAGQPNLSEPLESPENGRINGGVALNNSISAQSNVRQRGVLLTPRQLSAQYDELTQRLERYQNPQMAAIEAAHQRLVAQQQAQRARSGGPTQPPTSQPAGLAAQAMLRPMQPLKIDSLATGIHAKGLHDLLRSAEDLMRQGKFQSAIDKYNTAEQVLSQGNLTANVSLVLLGRGVAELGAGFYRQASTDLHRALSDRSLLMGQYNLSAWIPQDRLQLIRQELEKLAETDRNSEMPVFLLGFIAYNTGNETDAARYLAQAQQRAGKADPLLPVLSRFWNLPESHQDVPARDINK